MSVALCVLRIKVDEDLPEMDDNSAEVESAKEQKKKDRGSRESKTITVETYASVLSHGTPDPGILPTSSRRSTPEGSDDQETISFFCENPLVEVTKGVLHLSKDNELREAEEVKTLCLQSVPRALGAADLLAFVAACHQDICHVRVLRVGSPDHYMALLTFHTYQAARKFHGTFSGVPYSSLEPNALCHVAWVSRVENASSAHTELPICFMCLEPMDESVAGVLTVQCTHSFHAQCLVRWSDARCPGCRCAQTPEPPCCAACLQCDSGEGRSVCVRVRVCVHVCSNGVVRQRAAHHRLVQVHTDQGTDEALEAAGSLWICLVCGHVGCGRYEKGHAAKHFLSTNHTYALQLGSNRVWDYAGNNLVHRLVQNKADGKLVAAEGGVGQDAAYGGEKLDSAQLEFTYILTQQLDTQRQYYEDKINKLESEQRAASAALEFRAEFAEREAMTFRGSLAPLIKKYTASKQRLQTLAGRVTSLRSELREERRLASALTTAHRQLQERAKATEEKLTKESLLVSELTEQLRDLIFSVEQRSSLTTAAEPDEFPI